jgi:hypothetical protein
LASTDRNVYESDAMKTKYSFLYIRSLCLPFSLRVRMRAKINVRFYVKLFNILCIWWVFMLTGSTPYDPVRFSSVFLRSSSVPIILLCYCAGTESVRSANSLCRPGRVEHVYVKIKIKIIEPLKYFKKINVFFVLLLCLL